MIVIIKLAILLALLVITIVVIIKEDTGPL